MKTYLDTETNPLTRDGKTHQFALNAAIKDGAISTDFGNRLCKDFPDKRLVGGIYVDNIGYVLFFSRNDGLSEIGVLNDDCKYVQEVVADLGFNPAHRIEVVTRRKEGCGLLLYWTDGYNKPMWYILGKPERFKNDSGDFIPELFHLQQTIDRLPQLTAQVQNTGGRLRVGTYEIGIMYADEEGNEFPVIDTIGPYVIYPDNTSGSWPSLSGGVGKVEDYVSPPTQKSIKVRVDNLDPKFKYYKLIFVEKSGGAGTISYVKVSNLLSTSQREFIFTGENYEREEGEAFVRNLPFVFKSANAITIDDGSLVLGGVKYDTGRQCVLQRYASKIAADLKITKVLIDDTSDIYNSKSPEFLMHAGYMPGSIHSFDIVYIFEDGTFSSRFHIPGKPRIYDDNGNEITEDFIFSPDEDVYPMSAENNENINLFYKSSCGFYGHDVLGNELEGHNVRFHRFPTREKIGVPFIEEITLNETTTAYWAVEVKTSGRLYANNADYDGHTYYLRLKYEVDGIQYTKRVKMSTNIIDKVLRGYYHRTNNITNVVVDVLDSNGNTITPHSFSYTYDITNRIETTNRKLHRANLFHVKFSNIELPDEKIVGKRVIGYKILRQIRKEADKNILGHGMTYSVVNDKLHPDAANYFDQKTQNQYVGAGLLFPEMNYYDWKIEPGNDDCDADSGDTKRIAGSKDFNEENRIEKGVVGVISPEILNGDSINAEYVKVVGRYDIATRSGGIIKATDVAPGTSYDPEIHDKKDGEDKDGWSLKIARRLLKLRFFRAAPQEAIVKDVSLLSPGESLLLDDGRKLYNIAANTRTGVVRFESDDYYLADGTLVQFRKDHSSFFNDYETAEYVPIYTGEFKGEGTESCVVEYGDSYAVALTIPHLVFFRNAIAHRGSKSATGRIVAGVAIMLFSIVATLLTGNTLLGNTGMQIGYALLRSGIKISYLKSMLQDIYNDGLKFVVKNKFINHYLYYVKWAEFSENCYSVTGPEDDEIQWVADVVDNLWFESYVPLQMKYKFDNGFSEFLDSPLPDIPEDTDEEVRSKDIGAGDGGDGFYVTADEDKIPDNTLDTYLFRKLVDVREDKRVYLGAPYPEFFDVNKDYTLSNPARLFVSLAENKRCCGTCYEDYPGRFVWSEQVSSDNVSDKMRIYRPLDYRDLEGNPGEIKRLFTFAGKLYIHTDIALFVIGRKFKEKVIDDVVTYIGTGDKYQLPPVRLSVDGVDDIGLPYKWASILTQSGYYWINQREGKIFHMAGTIRVISDDISGSVRKFFQDLDSNAVSMFVDSLPGVAVGFDPVYERIFFTQRKYNALSEDNLYCVDSAGNLLTFEDYKDFIAQKESEGLVYIGHRDCKLQFLKTTLGKFTIHGGLLSEVLYDWHVVFLRNNNAANDLQGFPVFRFIQDFGNLFKSVTVVNATGNNIFKRVVEYVNNTPSLSGQKVVFIDFTSRDRGIDSSGDPLPDSELVDSNGDFRQEFLEWYDKVTGENTSGMNSSGWSIATVLQDYRIINLPYLTFARGFVGSNPIHDMEVGYHRIMLKVMQGLSNYATLNAYYLGNPPNDKYLLVEYPMLLNTRAGAQSPFVNQLMTYKAKVVFNERFDLFSDTINYICNFSAPRPLNIPDDIVDTGVNDMARIPLIRDSLCMCDGLCTTHYTDLDIQVSMPELELVEFPFETLVARESPQILATISYDINEQKFISWHSYYPKIYLGGELWFATYNGRGIWLHHEGTKFGRYYGTQHPFQYDYVIPSKNKINNVYSTIYWDTVVNNEDTFKTFDRLVAYNNNQSTGWKDLVVFDHNKFSIKQQGSIIRRRERQWYFNDIRDMIADKSLPVYYEDFQHLLVDNWFTDRFFQLLDSKGLWTRGRLRGRYLEVRFSFSNFDGDFMRINSIGAYAQKHKIQ